MMIIINNEDDQRFRSCQVGLTGYQGRGSWENVREPWEGLRDRFFSGL